MPLEIELALELQRMDRILRDLEIEIRALPKRVAQFEAQTNAAKLHAEGAEADLEANRKESKRLEGANEDHKIKLAKLKKQIMDATTQDQVTAFQHEIDWAEKEFAANEATLFQLLEENEILAEKVKEAKAGLAQARKNFEEQKATATALSEVDRKKGVKVFRERNALHTSLPKTLRETYDRLRKSHKDGLVVADCTDEMCSGCLMTVRPALMQQIRTDREKLFYCESCRRMLFYNPPKAVVA